MSEKGFKYSILASGSSGNSFYLETPKKKILIDAGLSGKKITSLLAEINRKPEDLDAILITHEHSDHIHGVGVLSRKYGMDLYANEKTWQAMKIVSILVRWTLRRSISLKWAKPKPLAISTLRVLGLAMMRQHHSFTDL